MIIDTGYQHTQTHTHTQTGTLFKDNVELRLRKNETTGDFIIIMDSRPREAFYFCFC